MNFSFRKTTPKIKYFQSIFLHFSRNLNHIINRYEDTVTAQFYGHTHMNEFQLFYERSSEFDGMDGSRKRPTNIAFIGTHLSYFIDYNTETMVKGGFLGGVHKT